MTKDVTVITIEGNASDQVQSKVHKISLEGNGKIKSTFKGWGRPAQLGGALLPPLIQLMSRSGWRMLKNGTRARRTAAMTARVVAMALLLVMSVSTACRADSSQLWIGALTNCVPGTKFDVCVAALDAAKIAHAPSPAIADNAKEIGIKLDGGAFVGLTIHAEQDLEWRITQVGIGLNRKPGSERKELVDWFKGAVKGASLREAIGGNAANGCGTLAAGPAWAPTGGKDPEVELSLNTVPWHKPPHGKPMDAVFEKTKSADDGVTVCFMFAFDEKAPILSPDVMRHFLNDPLFAGKTRPAH